MIGIIEMIFLKNIALSCLSVFFRFLYFIGDEVPNGGDGEY
jgi:hypothetical protein